MPEVYIYKSSMFSQIGFVCYVTSMLLQQNEFDRLILISLERQYYCSSTFKYAILKMD